MVRRISNSPSSQIEQQPPKVAKVKGSNPLGRAIEDKTGSSKGATHKHLKKTHTDQSHTIKSQKSIKQTKHEIAHKVHFVSESKVTPPKSAEASISTESGKETLLLPAFTEEAALLAIHAMKERNTKRNLDPEELKKLSNFKHIVIGYYESHPEKRAMIRAELKGLHPHLLGKGAHGEQPGYVMMSGSIVEMNKNSSREDDAVKFLLLCLESGVAVDDKLLLKMIGTKEMAQDLLEEIVESTISDTATVHVTRDWLVKGLASFKEALKESYYMTPKEFLQKQNPEQLKEELRTSISERLLTMVEEKELSGGYNEQSIDTFVNTLHLTKEILDTLEPRIISGITKGIISQVHTENRRS